MVERYDLQSTPPNKIRRLEYAQEDAWIEAFLERVVTGHIATRWEDQPFVTPVNFWYDPGHHAIYFHTNISGRLRANTQRHPKVCFEASLFGKLLPANTALEFGIQYESVVAFGHIRLLEDPEEQRRVLNGLIAKYFSGMQPGIHYRPITDAELKRTAVFAIAIESWSGKRNWKDRAEQSPDWPPLDDSFFD